MQIFETLRFRLSLAIVRRRTDLVAVFTLFLLTLVGTWGLLRNGNVIGADAATQYYPWYFFLGESLRSGEVPGWNPYQFSGAPFAADPLSGWAYLPVMLLFTFLPLVAAAEGFVLLHLLLAGLSTYALARTLGMGVPGTLLAAVAYEFSGILYLQTVCCFTYVAVMSWLPLAFLSVELAVWSLRWPGQLSWWGMSGLALSQIFAAWFGQDSSCALLALSGYVAHRTLIFPLGAKVPGMRARLLRSALHGGAVFALGFGRAPPGCSPGWSTIRSRTWQAVTPTTSRAGWTTLAGGP